MFTSHIDTYNDAMMFQYDVMSEYCDDHPEIYGYTPEYIVDERDGTSYRLHEDYFQNGLESIQSLGIFLNHCSYELWLAGDVFGRTQIVAMSCPVHRSHIDAYYDFIRGDEEIPF